MLDAETRRRGDAGTHERGDAGTRGHGDREFVSSVSPRLRVTASPRLHLASPRLFLAVLIIASLLPFITALIRGEVFSYRDHYDYFVPLRHFTAEVMRSGELPMWNPFNGSGERWLANPQTGVFYPPFWIFLLLPFPAAYVLYLWFHILVLGLGAFFLFSRWSNRSAATVSALALMLGGPTLSFLDINNNLGTFAWFPFVILLAVHRAAGSRFPISVDAVVIAFLFLGGEPFLAAIGALIYAAVTLRGGPRRLVPVLIAALLAILLSGIHLVPFLELLQGSDRVSGTTAARDAIAPRDWLTTILPRVDPRLMSQRFIPSLYLTALIVFAAALGAAAARRLEKKRQNSVTGWLMLLLLVIVFAAGATLSPPAMELNRYPARLIPVGALAICALAAIGFEIGSERSRRWRAAAVAVLVASLVITIAMFGGLSWRSGSAVAWTIVAGVMLLAAPATFRAPLFLVPFLLADLMTASAPLLRAQPLDTSLQPYRSIVIPPAKLGRIFERDTLLLNEGDRRKWLSGYLNLLIPCFDAATPAPVVPARYLELYDRALFTPDFETVNFLSVGVVAAERDLYHHDYSAAGRFQEVTLYRNRAARPPAMLGSSSQPVRFLGANEVRVDVNSENGGVLSLNQLDASGWIVEIDGKPATSKRVVDLFRGVEVPGGRHEVRWIYRPRSFFVGAVLSTIALVVMTGEILLFCRRRRRGLSI